MAAGDAWSHVDGCNTGCGTGSNTAYEIGAVMAKRLAVTLAMP